MGVTDWEPRALPSEARCRVWAGLGGVFLACDEQGGVATMPAPAGPREYVFAVACGEGGIRVRPWLKGEPAGWNASFYPMTHPSIPEGWEKVGEWVCIAPKMVLAKDAVWLHEGGEMYTSAVAICGWSVPVRRILPAIPAGWEAVGEWHDTLSPCSEVYDWTLLQDGRIVQRGETFRGKDERIMGVHIRRVLPAVDWGDVPRGVELRPDCAFGGARNEVYVNGVHLGRVFDRTDGVYHTHAPNHEPVAGSPFASLPAAIVALTGRRDE